MIHIDKFKMVLLVGGDLLLLRYLVSRGGSLLIFAGASLSIAHRSRVSDRDSFFCSVASRSPASTLGSLHKFKDYYDLWAFYTFLFAHISNGHPCLFVRTPSPPPPNGGQ